MTDYSLIARYQPRKGQACQSSLSVDFVRKHRGLLLFVWLVFLAPDVSVTWKRTKTPAPAILTHPPTPRPVHMVYTTGCVMDMRHPDGVRARNVYLPRGSLLVMEGAARYEWSHGIASRKTDLVCC